NSGVFSPLTWLRKTHTERSERSFFVGTSASCVFAQPRSKAAFRNPMHEGMKAKIWCPRPESNWHALRRGIFLPLRLSPPSLDKQRSWSGARLHLSLSAVG